MSSSLADMYAKMHRDDPFCWPGRTTSAGATVGGLSHAYLIKKLIAEHKAKTVLDYGCGKGFQYKKDEVHRWWGLMPRLYDPFVPGLDNAPRPDERFDGVICVDVLEHVEEAEIPELLRRVVIHAEKFLYVTACTRPAGRPLPDGRNAHVTLKTTGWWRDKFRLALKAGDKSPTFDARLEFSN